MEYNKLFSIVIAFLFFLLLAGCLNVPLPSGSQIQNQVVDSLQSAKTDYETRSGHARFDIRNSAIAPETLTVPAGTFVAWENWDTVTHAIVFEDRSFWTGDLKAQGLDMPSGVSKRFDTVGEFPFYCKYHPEMTGTLIVLDRMQFTDECGNQFCGRNEEYVQNCPEDCPR